VSDLLVLESVRAGYGQAVVLPDLSLRLVQGRSLAVLGRNGVGKTTLINTIVGVTRRFAGTIRIAGRDVSRLRPEQRAQAGVGWVPQERNIFRSLTVEENLAAVARSGRWDVKRVFEMFPRLAERRTNLGGQLSGGEQQMLAIGRALVLNPKILLLDEPTEGLAPIIVEELLKSLVRLFHDEGMAAILVEQHAQKVLGITDETIILDRGTIVHAGPSAALREDSALLERHLGVSRKSGAPRPGNPQPAV
jgi:branched-chain amino acid transport system ATP-binding protein